MSLTEERFRKLKAEVEEAKSSADRSKGALEQLNNRLKDEFNCSSIKEAKQLLEDLQRKRDKAEEKFNRLMKNYTETWKRD